ncbi:tape measure protein [Corynebacterium aurimucosum]
MAGAAGYAVLPTTISLAGIGKELQDKLLAPTSKAAKKAGDSIEKGIKSGADDAAKRVEKANYRVKKSSEELADAEAKRNSEVLKSQAAAKQLEAAESKLSEMKKSGKATSEQLAKAEADVLNKRARVESTALNVEKAERGVEKAMTESVRAAESLESAERDLASASDDASDKSRQLSRAVDDADDSFGRMKLGASAVAGVVGGVFATVAQAAIGSMGELVSSAMEASDATDKFKQTLGFAGLDTSAIDKATAAAQEYADRTVYDLGDIQSMTAQLAANGVKDYTGLAEAAGNLNAVAGGNAETFKSVGMVMTQTAGAGKLTTENWNQLADAIPGASGKIQEALLDAGAYTGNFRDAMADGQITAEEFNDAVMKLGNEPIAQEAAQSTATFEGMLGNLQATVEGELAQAFNELKPIIGSIVDGFANAAGTVLPMFVGAVKAVAGGMQLLGEHKGVVLGVVGALGSLTAGLAAYNAASSLKDAGGFVGVMKSMKTAIMETTVAQNLLNAAMWKSPITWITAAIVAVGVALWAFFTKTETGRKMWESFTEALGAGWDWVVDKFKAGISWIQSTFGPVFSQIGDTISGAWDATVEKVTGAVDRVKEIVSGALEFWKTGDSTDYAEALGMNPDSPIFTYLELFRDKLIALKDFAVEAWGFMSEKWGEFAAGFGQFYETWIAPIVSFMGDAFQVLGTIVVGAFKGIWSAIELVGSIISTVWSSVIQPTLSVFMSVVQGVASFVAPIFTAVIGGAFRTLGTLISDIWNGVIKPTWDFFRNAAGLLADVLTGNFSNIGNRFSSMGDAISNVVRGTINAAMNLFKSIFENAKGVAAAFAQSVGNMVNSVRGKIGEMMGVLGQIPSKIQGVFASAGTWLVNAGKNIISGLINGIKSMFGQVGNAIGSVMPDKVRGMLGFMDGGVYMAEGGITRAYLDGGIDKLERYANGGAREDHRAQIAKGGEWRVWAEPETGGESYIPLAKSKRKRSIEILAKTADIFGLTVLDKKGERITPAPYSAVEPLKAQYFAEGGITAKTLRDFVEGRSANGYQAARSLEGAPYVWGGSNWGDCSGAMSAVAAFAAGLNPFPRKFATGSEAAWLSANGFKSGRGKQGDLRIGFKNGGPAGGHTAGTLPDGTNVEMGGGRGNGQIGGAAAGAWDSYFNEFFYKTITPPKPPKMNAILDQNELPDGTSMTLDGVPVTVSADEATGSAGENTVTVALSPEDAAKATAAKGLGDQSILDFAVDGIFDMLGMKDSTIKKLLTTKGNDLLPSGDSIVTTREVRDQARTNVAKKNAKAIEDDALKNASPSTIAKDKQLRIEPEKKADAEWGQPFFAKEIAEAAKRAGVGAKGAQIGVATALVESGDPMKMWANNAVPESLKYRHDAVGSDYDSVGLFQQRDNGAWGEVWQRMDPYESAAMFFRQLYTFKWQDMDPGAAAQKVQGSAFPGRYAQQMGLAEELVNKTGVFGGGSSATKPEVQLKGAFKEFSSAWDGADAGMVDTSLLLRSEDAAKAILNLVEERGKAKTGVAAKDASPVASYKHLMTTGDYDGRMAQIGIHEDDDLVGAVLDARRAGAVYDQGGWLKPGGIAFNLSNEPEPVFNGDQWREIKRGGLNGEQGMTLVVNLEGQEVLRKRVDKVEGEVTINTEEISKLRRRTGVAVAATTRGGAM